jgi:hypothetical protein
LDVICLDANVLFSAAYSTRTNIRQLWDLPDTELIAASHAVEEAARNLRSEPQRAELDRLMRSVRVIDYPVFAAIPDDVELVEKDRPILLAAIHSRASHLLTGDFRHFSHLYGERISGVLILPPAAYLHGRH